MTPSGSGRSFELFGLIRAQHRADVLGAAASTRSAASGSDARAPRPHGTAATARIRRRSRCRAARNPRSVFRNSAMRCQSSVVLSRSASRPGHGLHHERAGAPAAALAGTIGRTRGETERGRQLLALDEIGLGRRGQSVGRQRHEALIGLRALFRLDGDRERAASGELGEVGRLTAARRNSARSAAHNRASRRQASAPAK